MPAVANISERTYSSVLQKYLNKSS